MQKENTQTSILSQPLSLSSIKSKAVVVNFDGTKISSDGGLLLLRETEAEIGVIRSLAEVMKDSRHPSYVKHTIDELLSQRIGQIACGYEDANDCNALRSDPIFKLFAGRLPENDPDLASQPTHTRFENAVSRPMLYRIAEVFVEVFLRSYEKAPKVIVLDFDDTEDPVHGGQQLRLFHALFDNYCYMPLHVYEGLSGKLITTILRPGKRMSGKETLMILKRLVKKLRQVWPNTLLVFRGDSHFSSPEVLAWSDSQENFFVVTGLAKNAVLKERTRAHVARAKKLYEQTGRRSRLFHSFYYQAESWHRPFRVIAKIEYSEKQENLRFVVTDFEQAKAQPLYEKVYCARGKSELFIKDHKLHLKSGRTSCHRFEANQFRVFLHSAAYVLLHALRSEVLRHCEWHKATFETIRLRVLKIGTRVREMQTRIKIEFPCSYPNQKALVNSLQLFEVLRLAT